jgi:hypothetical protein
MRLAIILSVIFGPAFADVKGTGGRLVECFCTDTEGARVELGEQICLFVNGRAFMAKCDMSLNVPIWRDTGDGCISSSLDQPDFNFSKPAVQSFPVSSEVSSG